MKNNNKGFSLTLVIAVMVLASILVATTITIVSLNYEMKSSQKRVTQNTYGAEAGLNYLVEGLQEICQETMNNAYQTVLVKYGAEVGTTEDEQRNINDKFAITYLESLKTKLNSTDFSLLLRDRYDKVEHSGGSSCKLIGNPSIILEETDTEVKSYLTIEGVKIKYTSKRGEVETLVTDLVVESPSLFSGKMAISGSNDITDNTTTDKYEKYALITDKTIEVQGGSSNSIEGNIYCGGHTDKIGVYTDGLSVGNISVADLDIKADTFISRGDISIYDTMSTNSYLSISGKNKDNADVYINNLRTKKGEVTTHLLDKRKVLDMTSNLYVREDTDLDRNFMSIKLNGAYYGFTPDKSAFNINGRYVDADLSGLTTLMISGSSYLDLPINEEDNSYVEIGDSLTGKFSQTVYMIPAECVYKVTVSGENMNIEHIGNPISADLYNSARTNNRIFATSNHDMNTTFKEKFTEDGEYLCFDFQEYNTNHGIYIPDYVNINGTFVEPITPVYREDMSIEGGIRTYLYFKFSDKESAAKYLTTFNSKFSNYIEHASKSFNYGDVSISDDSALYTVGNILVNSGGSISVLPNTSTLTDNFIVEKSSSIAKDYNSLASTLKRNIYTGVTEYNDSCFDNVISLAEYEVVKDINANTEFCFANDIVYEKSDIDYNGDKLNVVICKGDVRINSGLTKKGLIITTGKCTLANGVDFEGTIMAKEGIIIQGSNNKVTTNNSEGSILGYLLYNSDVKDDITKYFNDIESYAVTSISDEYRNPVIIKYENWMVY